jgi:hypothetical protein
VAEVDISGRSSTFVAQVELTPRDAANIQVSALEVQPAQAEVTIPVHQVSSKTVPVVPIVAELPAGEEIQAISVSPVAVTLSGPSRLLAGVEAVNTVPVDVKAVRGRGTYSVPLRVPTGLAVLGAASVRVTVTVRPGTGYQGAPGPTATGEVSPGGGASGGSTSPAGKPPGAGTGEGQQAPPGEAPESKPKPPQSGGTNQGEQNRTTPRP